MLIFLRIGMFALIVLSLSNASSLAADSAFDWLTKHQEADGRWDSVKYGAVKKTDTATTSLAVLSLLGAGHSEKVGQYKDNVKRAVAWLISQQDENGKILATTDAPGAPDEAYSQALALLAISEAASMANVPATRAAAQKAVDFCCKNAPFNGKTGDDCAVEKDVDLPTIGWFMVALKSAKVAGLHVDHAVFDAIIKYLDAAEHKLPKAKEEDVEASEYRFSEKVATDPNHPAYRVTAIGTLCRQFLGWKREDLQGTVEAFVKRGGVPQWDEGQKDADVYYWWFGTLCVFQQGGEAWTKWSEALQHALLKNQLTDGDDDGMWDGKGFAAEHWGRVGQTAMACLCLEIRVRWQMLRP